MRNVERVGGGCVKKLEMCWVEVFGFSEAGRVVVGWLAIRRGGASWAVCSQAEPGNKF
jgi:hypothetical protein